MSALSITPALVLASQPNSATEYKAGATITAGQPLFYDAATATVKLADSNDATKLPCIGISLNGASAGQPVAAVSQDTAFHPGAALVVGQTYCAGATAGTIVPISDLTTGDYPNILFVATSTSVAILNVTAGTAAKP